MRIAAIGLTGWAAIVGLAYHLADRRIAQCGISIPNTQCVIRLSTQRDAILIGGLTVGLIFILLCLSISTIIRARQGERPVASTSRWRPASRERQALPR